MFETLRNAWKIPDLRRKILFTLFILLIFRLGSVITVPFVDVTAFGRYYEANLSGTLFGMLNIFSGSAFSKATIFAMSISPYINASIIMQLLTVAIPKFEQWSKQGEEGKKKLSQATRVATLILATAQAVGIMISWLNANLLMPNLFNADGFTWLIASFVVIILVAGACFTMWLGEKITEFGIGNGISLIIFVGILATAGFSLIAAFRGVFRFDDQSLIHVWQIGFMTEARAASRLSMRQAASWNWPLG